MKHTEDSIRNIKKSLAEMWSLVQSQVEKSSAALLDGNKELAHEITSREKLVDSYELTVDRECENFFASLTPVAVDLRMILSIIKINNNLERIGDFADGIAHFVIHNQTEKINTELLGQLQIREMFDEAICMLKLCKSALANEDSHMAGKVFAEDTARGPAQHRKCTPAGHHTWNRTRTQSWTASIRIRPSGVSNVSATVATTSPRTSFSTWMLK